MAICHQTEIETSSCHFRLCFVVVCRQLAAAAFLTGLSLAMRYRRGIGEVEQDDREQVWPSAN